MGGAEKRGGEENLTKDTPLKTGFWTPLRLVRFPSRSGVIALFFLYKTRQLSRPEAHLERSRNFREGAFSGTFSSPHALPPPHHPHLQVLQRPCHTKIAISIAIHYGGSEHCDRSKTLRRGL